MSFYTTSSKSVVIYKDPDSDYGMVVSDLLGRYTICDPVADVLTQVVEAIELHLECLLLDGDPILEPKDLTFHQNNPDYASGHWKSVAVIIPTDVSKMQDIHPGPIQRFFPMVHRTHTNC